MNNQPSFFVLLRRPFLVLVALALFGLLGGIFLARPALADTPIFVRPAGNDEACNGTANVDYTPVVAPVCAVKTAQRASVLAGSTNTIIFDTGTQTITIPPNASASESGDISIAEVELLVDKTDSPDPVWVESPLTYTVRISNTGDESSSSVELFDTLPHEEIVSFKSATLSGCSSCNCNLIEPINLVYCELGDLGSNAMVTATIVVTPIATGNIDNQATVRDGDGNGAFDEETTHFEGITDLSVSKTDDPDPVTHGQPLTYTITVTNGGPSAAISVVLTDDLPMGTTFGSATSSQGECGSGNPLTCTLDLMDDDDVATVTVVVTPTTFGWITNTVTVGGGDNDAPSNNTFTETTWVTPQTDLQVSKNDEPDPVPPGATLTYTLAVYNNGPGPAAGVTLADTLPDEFNFNTASGNMLLLHLDEVTGATSFADASGNNHNGSCNDLAGSCPTAGVAGPPGFGPALQFDGDDDFVDLANPSGLNIDGQITLMAWVNISDTFTLQNIIAHGHTSLPSPAGVHLRIYSGYYQVGSWNGVDSLTSWLIPGGDVGNWVHLAGVYDGNEWQLYHNGIPVGTPYVGTGALPVAENWAIGAMGDGSDRFFDGLIDEVAIFDRALSGAEIAAIYDEALTGRIYLDPDQGSCGAVSGGVHCNLGDLNPSAGVTVTLIGTVAPTATGTILNTVSVTATTVSDPDLNNNTDTVTTNIQDGSGDPGPVYLPIILKNFANPSLSFYWNDWEPVRDKVSPINGGAGLVPDGREDGVFRAILDMGSQTKTVVAVDLTTTQGAGIIWDTIGTSGHWLLGVFDGVALNDSGDGTIDQEVSGVVEVSLYASDVDSTSPLYSLFPPDEYTYTVTVYFDDGSSLSASARIPPEGEPAEPPAPPPPPPPPGPSACQPIAEIEVGDDPRGVVVDETRNRIYVANYDSDSVSVINTDNNSVWDTIDDINSANGITHDLDRNIIWVTNYSDDEVTPIEANSDATSFTVLPAVAVGDGPWGVAYGNDYVYVANRNSSTVTIIDAADPADKTTLNSGFNQPYHLAANPNSNKVYVANFGNHTVTVINGRSVSSVINLNVDDPSTQPYGIAVDEIRNVVYVAAVNSHRVVAIDGAADEILGWATFHRGFGDPTRPAPLRVIAVNPDIGPFGDGGHLWTATATADGSEVNQALLVPKGWGGFFHFPMPCDVGIDPSEGIAVHRSLDRAYVSSGNDTDNNPGTLSVFEDPDPAPLVPFSAAGGISIEFFQAE